MTYHSDRSFIVIALVASAISAAIVTGVATFIIISSLACR
jgi:hypothetical protein